MYVACLHVFLCVCMIECVLQGVLKRGDQVLSSELPALLVCVWLVSMLCACFVSVLIGR
jgi:hypothetical protein